MPLEARWPRAGFDSLDRWIAKTSICAMAAPGAAGRVSANRRAPRRSRERRFGRCRRSRESRATSRPRARVRGPQRVAGQESARLELRKGRFRANRRSPLSSASPRNQVGSSLSSERRHVSQGHSGLWNACLALEVGSRRVQWGLQVLIVAPWSFVGAPGLDCRALELGGTLRTKKRRRRVLRTFLREKTAFGFPTAPLNLSSREPAV